MFRSRFSECFPKSLPHFGPQDIERDVSEPVPGDIAESFLCALLGLLLNRKQDVKYASPLRAGLVLDAYDVDFRILGLDTITVR